MGWSVENIDWATTWSGVQGLTASAALWFAVVQVTRDGRARRRRARAQLATAESAVRTAIETLQLIQPEFGAVKTEEFRRSAWALHKIGMFAEMRAQLDAIPLHDLEDVEAVDVLVAARVALASGARDCAAHAEAGPAPTRDFVSYCITRLEPLHQRLKARLKSG